MHNPKSILAMKRINFPGVLRYEQITLFQPDEKNLVIVNKKKTRTCRITDFAVPIDHREKLNKKEKREKNLDLAR